MTDEDRMFRLKRRVAEHVVKMAVGVDHITHRQWRMALERGAQRSAGRETAAGINHRDAFFADDETEVGAIAALWMIDADLATLMDKNAAGNFGQIERRCRVSLGERHHRDPQGQC